MTTQRSMCQYYSRFPIRTWATDSSSEFPGHQEFQPGSCPLTTLLPNVLKRRKMRSLERGECPVLFSRIMTLWPPTVLQWILIYWKRFSGISLFSRAALFTLASRSIQTPAPEGYLSTYSKLDIKVQLLALFKAFLEKSELRQQFYSNDYLSPAQTTHFKFNTLIKRIWWCRRLH